MKVLARTNTVVQFNLKMHLLFFRDECPGGDLKEKVCLGGYRGHTERKDLECEESTGR